MMIIRIVAEDTPRDTFTELLSACKKGLMAPWRSQGASMRGTTMLASNMLAWPSPFDLH